MECLHVCCAWNIIQISMWQNNKLFCPGKFGFFLNVKYFSGQTKLWLFSSAWVLFFWLNLLFTCRLCILWAALCGQCKWFWYQVFTFSSCHFLPTPISALKWSANVWSASVPWPLTFYSNKNFHANLNTLETVLLSVKKILGPHLKVASIMSCWAGLWLTLA